MLALQACGPACKSLELKYKARHGCVFLCPQLYGVETAKSSELEDLSANLSQTVSQTAFLKAVRDKAIEEDTHHPALAFVCALSRALVYINHTHIHNITMEAH